MLLLASGWVRCGAVCVCASVSACVYMYPTEKWGVKVDSASSRLLASFHLVSMQIPGHMEMRGRRCCVRARLRHGSIRSAGAEKLGPRTGVVAAPSGQVQDRGGQEHEDEAQGAQDEGGDWACAPAPPSKGVT